MVEIGFPLTETLAELIVASGQQDRRAFAQLYKLSSPKLYAIALRILKHEGSAQDCLQESFINVWRQAQGYHQSQSAAMTWLSTIVRNKAIDMLRHQQRHQQGQAMLYQNEEDHHFFNDDSDQIALEKCFSELPIQQADCIRLAYYSGLTHSELSQYLTLPIGTIKTWIRSGLDKLRRCLQK